MTKIGPPAAARDARHSLHRHPPGARLPVLEDSRCHDAARQATVGSSGATLAIVVVLLALAAGLAVCWRQLPPEAWVSAALHPDPARPAELVFCFATLPRLAVAALAGAALAVAGTIFQHVLGNPLASPTTLGVPAGAQLAMIAVALLSSSTSPDMSQVAALLGGGGAMALALVAAAPWRFAPAVVILAGLAVGLFLGALGHALKLFNGEYLASVMLWNAGALDQTDWSLVVALLPRLAALAVMTIPLLRPLDLLRFGEEGARGLGLSTGGFRGVALAVAVAFAAVIVATVGTVGFVDIAAPLVARLAGARRLRARLVLAPVIGAALLVLIDAIVQVTDARFESAIPTGAVTAMLAAPLMLSLVPRLRADPLAGAAQAMVGWRRRPVLLILSILAGLSVGAFAVSCLVGLSSPSLADVAAFLPWRLPRAAEAFAAGAMLATAGTVLQRTTGNMLASPEILGLGAAVVAGFAVVLFLSGTVPSRPVLIAAGAISAGLLTVALFGSSFRGRFAPDQVLLRGVALTAALNAVVTTALASTDSRAQLLLDFAAGSAVGATPGGALALTATAAVLVPATLVGLRGLDILPLGEEAARGVGLRPATARAGLFGMSALLTAIAVFAVGPLTFVGLVGPHLARRLGLHGAMAEVPGAALVGGLVMLVADWVGRVALAPFELPAGLVAALIGCPYLVFQLRRSG